MTEDEMDGWHDQLDREACLATVHGVAKSQIQLSPCTELKKKRRCKTMEF